MEENKELNVHEELEKKRAEFKEKYADVIKNLVIKYGKPVDIGYDMLCGIARGVIYDVEPLYVPDVEYNKDEMVEDYKVIEELSNKTVY